MRLPVASALALAAVVSRAAAPPPEDAPLPPSPPASAPRAALAALLDVPDWARAPVTAVVSPNNRDQLVSEPGLEAGIPAFLSSGKTPLFPLARLLHESLLSGGAAPGTLELLDRLWHGMSEWNGRMTVGVKADATGRFVRWELYFCFTVLKQAMQSVALAKAAEAAEAAAAAQGRLDLPPGFDEEDAEFFAELALGVRPGGDSWDADEGSESDASDGRQCAGGGSGSTGGAHSPPMSWTQDLVVPAGMRSPELEGVCMLRHLCDATFARQLWLESLFGLPPPAEVAAINATGRCIYTEACDALSLPPYVRGVSVDLYGRGEADGHHSGGASNSGGNVEAGTSAPSSIGSSDGVLSELLQVYMVPAAVDRGGRVLPGDVVDIYRLNVSDVLRGGGSGIPRGTPPRPEWVRPVALTAQPSGASIPLGWEGRDACLASQRAALDLVGVEWLLERVGFNGSHALSHAQVEQVKSIVAQWPAAGGVCIARKWKMRGKAVSSREQGTQAAAGEDGGRRGAGSASGEKCWWEGSSTVDALAEDEDDWGVALPAPTPSASDLRCSRCCCEGLVTDACPPGVAPCLPAWCDAYLRSSTANNTAWLVTGGGYVPPPLPAPAAPSPTAAAPPPATDEGTVDTLYVSWQGINPTDFLTFARSSSWDEAFLTAYVDAGELYDGQPLEVVRVYEVPPDGGPLAPDRSGMHFIM